MYCSFNTQKVVMSHVSIQLECIFSITCFNFMYKYKITRNIIRWLYWGYLVIIFPASGYQHFPLIYVFHGNIKTRELSFQGYSSDIRELYFFTKQKILHFILTGLFPPNVLLTYLHAAISMKNAIFQMKQFPQKIFLLKYDLIMPKPLYKCFKEKVQFNCTRATKKKERIWRSFVVTTVMRLYQIHYTTCTFKRDFHPTILLMRFELWFLIKSLY